LHIANTLHFCVICWCSIGRTDRDRRTAEERGERRRCVDSCLKRTTGGCLIGEPWLLLGDKCQHRSNVFYPMISGTRTKFSRNVRYVSSYQKIPCSSR